jgi:O-antigen/teichoic acid export membrane protein
MLRALRGFIGARVLGPSLYGVWQAVRLVLRLADLSPLGVVEALKREVPLARGRQDAGRIAAVRGVTSAVVLAGAAPIVAGCLVAALVAALSGVPDWAGALAAAGLAALCQQLFVLADADLRAEACMQRSAAAGFAAALTSTLLAWPLAAALGVAGFAGAVAAGFVAGLGVGVLWPPWRLRPLRPRRRRGTAGELIRVGFPIQLAQAAANLRRSVDKLVLLVVLGTTAAGLYGLADTFAGLLAVLPMAVAAAVAPHALEHFGRTGDRDALRDALARPFDVLSRVGPLLAGLAAVLSEPAILLVLPRFAPGIVATKILALTMLWAGLEKLALNVLVALGRQRRAALLSLAFGFAAAGLDVVLLWLGLGIEAVAAVSLLSGAFLAVTLAWLAYRRLGVAVAPRALAWPLARLVYGSVALLVVELAADRLPGGVWSRAAGLVVLTLPLLKGVRRAAA